MKKNLTPGKYEYPSYASPVAGSYKLTADFDDPLYGERRVARDINFTPNDQRLPDLGICRIYSSRRDAEIILRALTAAATERA